MREDCIQSLFAGLRTARMDGDERSGALFSYVGSARIALAAAAYNLARLPKLLEAST
jgi:hypothetical protein